jgi:hypothetical protein
VWRRFQEYACLVEKPTLFSELMKNVTLGILFCTVAFATSVIYGSQEASGVYGIDVVVKQKPSNHAVTDPNGNFALESLPPGSYTLSFRARPAKDLRSSTRDKVIVATSYSIKIEGTKSPANRSGLTSDKILAGVDIAVQVGSGAKVRGRVLPAGSKKMVWVPQRVGSNFPGHWAEEGSEEASPHNIVVYGGRNWIDNTR